MNFADISEFENIYLEETVYPALHEGLLKLIAHLVKGEEIIFH